MASRGHRLHRGGNLTVLAENMRRVYYFDISTLPKFRTGYTRCSTTCLHGAAGAPDVTSRKKSTRRRALFLVMAACCHQIFTGVPESEPVVAPTVADLFTRPRKRTFTDNNGQQNISYDVISYPPLPHLQSRTAAVIA